MMQETEIIIKPGIKEKCKHIIKQGIDPLIAGLLYDRGIDSHQKVKLFLEGSFDDMHDPGEIKNIEEAFELLVKR